MTKTPKITRECVKQLLETKYIRVYDLQYEEGRHYYDVSRRPMDRLIAVKNAEEFRSVYADAVTCIVIIETENEEPRLLLSYEFRYPAGRYLLSPPAGLIDPDDGIGEEVLLHTARREIREETGIVIRDTDSVRVVNPLVFSTPGMSDESNALVCAVIRAKDLSELSQDGAEETEHFDGFALLTREEARKVLADGCDANGIPYSVYTWAALVWFVSDLWKAE
ncbi:MAG: NUDIX hydrolase [Clostridia bacterium]|nr:NUDIX hydrolase [Clostridia bacterium]